jgi:2'-5' RNA ligase
MQPYCSHPPHCTLIHANVTQEAQAVEGIHEALGSFSAFRIEVAETGVFWEDGATGGGHTLFWRIKPTPALYKLQARVAEALRSLLAENKVAKFVKTNPVLRESFERYGFPFIGSHWIPHLTIASLQTARDHPLIEAFLKQTSTFEMDVTEVSCWRVESEQHTCLNVFKLK